MTSPGSIQSPASEQLASRITRWKTARRAVILAHNYQSDEVQALADYTGDSLELARTAARTDAEVIAFAGVRFMAESAKILSPQKTVLLPVPEAGCPLADTIVAEDLANVRAEHPDAAVVVYVNSTVDVKAMADVCCTSANAVAVVNSLSQDEVICAPDKNLANWVARHTDKRIIPWPGSCCVHNNVILRALEEAVRLYPEAKVMVHPECRPEVCNRSDAVLSTSQMLRYARHESADTFIVGTEIGLLYRLRLENPGKRFYPLSPSMVCKNMKLTQPQHIADALETMSHPVEIPEPIRIRAVAALERMLAVS